MFYQVVFDFTQPPTNATTTNLARDLLSTAQGTSTSLVLEIITNYWLVILSALFVGFMISLFWWLARKVFGHRQM